MKRFLLCCILGVATTASSLSAHTNLWDELLDVVVTHIERDGPDADAAQFISMAQGHSWARREEMIKRVGPFLADTSPDKVAGAIEILYRFRAYSPMEYLGGFESESNNAAFFADLDKQVYPRFDHFRKLKSDRVYHALALYLGVSRTPQAKGELLGIARSPFAVGAKEQALICLAWHRDPADMDTLLPFMMEDSRAARLLPYHFRNSYGKLSIPSLVKAIHEGKSDVTRQEAALQLVFLGVAEGFDYLRDTVLKDPKALDRIKGWAFDYLSLARGVVSKEDVARQIDRKKEALAKNQP